MGNFANYLENEVMDHVLGASTYTPPSSVWVALSRGDPTDTGAGLDEPPGGAAYARQEITNNLTEWPAAVNGTKSNTNKVTFPEATGAWGTVTHFALFDHPTAGNMLMHSALNVAKAVTAGDVIEFPATSISVQLG